MYLERKKFGEHPALRTADDCVDTNSPRNISRPLIQYDQFFH